MLLPEQLQPFIGATMKFTLVLLVAFISSSTFAQTSPCAKKQIAAAKSKHAVAVRTLVTNIKLVKYEAGGWSEAMSNNSGYDLVTLSVNRAIQTYTVYARQIGYSADCVVTRVEN